MIAHTANTTAKETAELCKASDRGRGICLLVGCLLGITIFAVPAFGQHIHQLLYNNSDWVDTDLSNATGGPTVYAIGVAAFYTTPNDQLHVYYVSSGDFHIHQLYYNGSVWSDEDLTNATGGGTTAYSGTGMGGFAIGNAQYVYFCDPSFDVHEFAYGNGGDFNWVDTNLNALIGQGYPRTCADYADSMVAFATKNNNRHVFFQGPHKQGRNDIREFEFNGTKWSDQDLTGHIPGSTAYGTWMSAFAIKNSSYLFFQAPNGHIHQYSFGAPTKAWVDTDVTVASGGVAADTFEPNGPAAFAIPGTGQIEVYYSTGEDVHQMTFQSNSWSDENLTTITAGPAPYSLGQLVAFATTPNDQLHFYSTGQGNNTVDQFFFNGSSWSYGALPSVNVAGLGPGMAGFSIGNYQYVFYISAN